MLEEFRELVRAGILRVTPENEVLPVKPPPAGEESRSASKEDEVALLDKQLLEWMDRRRARRSESRRGPSTAEQPPETLPPTIRQKVVERVASKIIETWDRADQSSNPHESFREQVIDRVAETILRRWQRNLE